MNFILWDVDGTLVLNSKEAGGLYHQAIENVVGRSIPNPLPNMHGKTDGQILVESLAAHGLDAGLHAAASAELTELSRLRHEAGQHRQAAPGALEAIAAAADAGWTNALLTGNGEARSRFKLTGAGFSADDFDWTHSYFGDIDPQRTDLTTRAARELEGSRIVIIGDTPNDDAAAVVAGIPFIAVATGAFTAEFLRTETGALETLDNLETGLPTLLHSLAALASNRPSPAR